MGRKETQYQQGRNDGLVLAYNICKKGGIEALEQEIKWRGVTHVNTAAAVKDLNAAAQKIKEQTIDTVKVLTVATLRDEFEFGKKRIGRFLERYDNKVECMLADLVNWNDLIQDIQSDLGIDLNIRWNK